MDKRFTTTRDFSQLARTSRSRSAATARRWGAAALCLAAVSVCHAQDQEVLDAEGITIFGQRELPKVLYIVPWKNMESSEIDMPVTESLVADVLNPIDPDVFRREIKYHELMHSEQAPKSK